jgi:hypothetical protein
MASYLDEIRALPDNIVYHSNKGYSPAKREPEPVRVEEQPVVIKGAGPVRHARKSRKARLGNIPNTATVAYKQNNNSGYVMVNAATAQRLMVNRTDPSLHGGRKRRGSRTRKN